MQRRVAIVDMGASRHIRFYKMIGALTMCRAFSLVGTAMSSTDLRAHSTAGSGSYRPLCMVLWSLDRLLRRLRPVLNTIHVPLHRSGVGWSSSINACGDALLRASDTHHVPRFSWK
jgi:hypothetical protein